MIQPVRSIQKAAAFDSALHNRRVVSPGRIRLVRWVKRDGLVVTWGNIIEAYQGQSCRDTMATEADAIERERQANACESLADDREPVPTLRQRLDHNGTCIDEAEEL